MYGNKFSPPLLVDNAHDIGPKALAVFGTLSLFGKTSVSWTKLSQTAEVGATSITLKTTVDWSVGSQIVIATSSKNKSHSEVVTISSVSGTVINFSPALLYRHYGVSESYGGKTIDLATEVGLL